MTITISCSYRRIYRIWNGSRMCTRDEFDKETHKIDDPYAEMLYTGFKDKSGKRIYEGDIVKVDLFPNSTFIVKFGKYCIGRSVDTLKTVGFFLREDTEGGDNLTEFDLDYEYTVIGNIYENPELLKWP